MLEKEIGSNFCETVEVSGEYVEDKDGIFFLDSGRSAISFILENLNKEKLRVILPIYTCESVIWPFINYGCEIRYYNVNKALEIVEDDFNRLIELFQPELVYIHSYFGFNTISKMQNKISELRLKDIILIEDVTHSMFSKNVHVDADFYVGSLRKWCSLPDGGFLKIASEKAYNIVKRDWEYNENSNFVEKRIKAQRAKEDYFANLDENKEKLFIVWYEESEDVLDSQKDVFTMSQYSRARLNSIDWQKIQKRRRENYLYLVEKMSKIPEVEIIAPEMQSGIVPLYCPVYIKSKRNELRRFAREENIMLPVIWPVPSMLKHLLESDIDWIYNHILALPCDQRYTTDDMSKIIELVNLFYSKG